MQTILTLLQVRQAIVQTSIIATRPGTGKMIVAGDTIKIGAREAAVIVIMIIDAHIVQVGAMVSTTVRKELGEAVTIISKTRDHLMVVVDLLDHHLLRKTKSKVLKG